MTGTSINNIAISPAPCLLSDRDCVFPCDTLVFFLLGDFLLPVPLVVGHIDSDFHVTRVFSAYVFSVDSSCPLLFVILVLAVFSSGDSSGDLCVLCLVLRVSVALLSVVFVIKSVNLVLDFEIGFVVLVNGLVLVNFVFLGQGRGLSRVGSIPSGVAVGVGVASTRVDGTIAEVIVPTAGVGLIPSGVVTSTVIDGDTVTVESGEGAGVGTILVNIVSINNVDVLVRTTLMKAVVIEVTTIVGVGVTIGMAEVVIIGGFARISSISKLMEPVMEYSATSLLVNSLLVGPVRSKRGLLVLNV